MKTMFTILKSIQNPIATKPAKMNKADDKWCSISAGFEWAPFHGIPNISEFSVELGSYDETLKAYGILRREGTKLKFKPNSNRHLQRYAIVQISRLRSAKSTRMFWLRARVILSRSVVFGLMGLSHVDPRWHREWRLSVVVGTILESMKIGLSGLSKLDYRRVYIEKSEGKLRPLGVPTPSWRLYLHLLNCMLLTAYQRLIPGWQHAYQPGKGTLTAWRSVLHDVLPSKYIYEFDYSGFFDAVPVLKVLDHLKNNGLSEFFYDQLLGMARTPPAYGEAGPSQLYLINKKQTEYNELKRVYHHATLESLYSRSGHARSGSTVGVSDYLSARNLAGISVEKLLKDTVLTGFPQGASTSAFLAVVLTSMLKLPKGKSIIMYADDGLIYSNKPISPGPLIKRLESIGVKINLDKSGFVRKSGLWLKPLKFLGLVYDGTDDSLSACTRSGGSVLKYDKSEALLSLDFKERGRKASPFEIPFWLDGGSSRVKRDLKGRWGLNSELVKDASVPMLEYVIWDPLNGVVLYQTDCKQKANQVLQDLRGDNSSSLFRLARVGLDGFVLNPDINNGMSWSQLATRQALGLVLSRMYCGSWNQKISQDFSLDGIDQSWLWHACRRGPLPPHVDFATSTSYAFGDVSKLVRRIRITDQFKRLFKEGTVRFSCLNDVRKRYGLHPLSRAWASKWQSMSLEHGYEQARLKIHRYYRGHRLHRCESVSVQCLELDWLELYKPYVQFLKANVKADKILKLHTTDRTPSAAMPLEYLSKYRQATLVVGAHSLELNGLAKLHPSHPSFKMDWLREDWYNWLITQQASQYDANSPYKLSDGTPIPSKFARKVGEAQRLFVADSREEALKHLSPSLMRERSLFIIRHYEAPFFVWYSKQWVQGKK